MIGKLNQHFSFYEAALKVRAYRQEVLASNLANADTPNYRARDIDFRSALQEAMQPHPSGYAMTTTHTRHLQGKALGPRGPDLLYRNEHQPSIDGNTVETDVEMAQFADNAVRYQAQLTFLNHKISSLRSVLQDR